VFSKRTILPNFTPIRFETTESWDFLRRGSTWQQEEEQDDYSLHNEVANKQALAVGGAA